METTRQRVVPKLVCSQYHRAVELIGRRWSGALLRTLGQGEIRYADLRGAIPGLSDTMLSQRMRELEAEGLVERHVLETKPVAVTYTLTEKGCSLRPVMDAIGEWAEEWL